MTTNRQLRLAARPVGLPKRSDWSFTEEPVARARRTARCWSRCRYISLDPAMRGWMNEGKSYIRPVDIGEVMRAGGVGRGDRVEASGIRGGRSRRRHFRRAGVRDRRTARA